MLTTPFEQTIHTLEIVRYVEIAAPMDIVFQCILEQLGPLNETPERVLLSLKLEPWPGGRWYRDLGNNSGHLWGFVQSIRSNDLLEIQGPMFMSAPAISHLLYRLTEEAGTTRIRFSHRAIGQIPPDHLDGVKANQGWTHFFDRLSELVDARHG